MEATIAVVVIMVVDIDKIRIICADVAQAAFYFVVLG